MEEAIKVFLCDSNTILPSEIERMKGKISFIKSRQVDRYTRKEDRNNSIIGEYIALHECSQKNRIPMENLVVGKKKYGKPFIENTHNTFHYNISHTGHTVVCAISNTPVGIDIQEIQQIPITTYRLFLSEYEQTCQYNAIEIIEKWTCKESYSKLLGKGVSISFPSITILPPNILDEHRKVVDNCTFSISITGKYVLSIASHYKKTIEFHQWI